MVRIVHAAVSGRVRLKVDGLHRSHELKKYLEEGLSKRDDVTHVFASPLTGNVLVLYSDPRTPSDIKNELHALLPLKDGAERADDARPKKAVIREDRVRPGNLRKRLVRAKDTPPQVLWHMRQPAEAAVAFGADCETGLALEAYGASLKRFGPNLLPEAVPRSGWSIFLEQFKSLPVLLLGVAAAVSVFTGGLADAVVIISVVGINAAIGYVTESKSEKIIRSLKSLVRPTALVRRAGELVQANVEDVAPGDLLVLRPGSLRRGGREAPPRAAPER